MDIIASFASSSAASTQASTSNQASGTTSEPFSFVLSQVSEAPLSNDSAGPVASTDASKAQAGALVPEPGSAPSTPTPSAVSRDVDSTPGDSVAVYEAGQSTTLPGSAMAGAALEPVEQPEQAESTPSTVQLSQQAAAISADPNVPLTDDNPGQDLYATADDFVEDADLNASDSASELDSSLEDIRQRMDLIQSAGQLDTTLMVVAPPAPLQVAVPVPASQGVLSADPDTSVSANRNLQASILTSVDTESETYQETTPDQVDVQSTVPALDGAVANAVQDLRKQTDNFPVDSQADGAVGSDVQSSFNLATLSLNSVSLTSTDKVATNGLSLSAAVGTADWQNGLGQQVIDMITRGEQQVDLRLNPTELGPLSISLNLSDGNTQAQFQSAHASVRTAVEQALPQLREALASQGISLGQASVSDDSSRQTSGDQAQRDSQGNRTDALMSRTDSALEVDEVPVQSIVVRSSGVDLYV